MRARNFFLVFAALGIAGAAGNLGRQPTQGATAAVADDGAAEIAWAMRSIVHKERDPDSTIFGDVFFVKEPKRAVCGTVNGRNGFGGMTGYKHFVAVVGTETIFFEGYSGNGSVASQWKRYCIGGR